MADYFYERMAGILLKTKFEYAETFLQHWELTKKPQVFCIYNRQPYLQVGDPIFCHIVKENRLSFVASFVRSEPVRAFKRVETREKCIQERDRIWSLYSNSQLHTDSKEEFDRFWDAEGGVRSLVLMKDLKRIEKIVRWGEVQRKILHTNFPYRVGYYYLSESDVREMFKLIGFEAWDLQYSPWRAFFSTQR